MNRKLPGKWLLVVALFLVATNLRPSIASIAPLLEEIRTDLGMDRTTVSLLTSIPVLCMGIFAPFAAKLAERWGINRTLTGCLVLIGIATLMRAWSFTASLLVATAFLVGIGIAIAGPLVSGFIKQHFPDQSALMVGLSTVGMGIGASMSAGLTVPLERLWGGSWEASLATWSVLAVLALGIWIPLMRKDAAAAAGKSNGNHGRGGALPWRNPRAWLLVFFFGMQSSLYYVMTAWMAPIARDSGMSELQAGTLLTFFMLLQMVCSLVIPILVNRTGSRRPWLIGLSGSMLGGLLLLAFSDLISPWIASIFIGIALGGIFPLALTLPLDETATAEEAGAWSAMMQSGGYLISSLGPLLVGVLRDVSGDFHLSLAAMLLIASSQLLLALRYRTPLAKAR